ncbi:MAG: SAM-dependent methyltransferase [Bacteroidetes bacterium]|nr:SAM-dependent methyltransferase [Bacteroidota bacterium]
MSSYGKLYLLPVPISDSEKNDFIPEHNLLIVRSLVNFIAEDAKTARRFLKWFGYPKIEEAEILLLNEHTKISSVSELLQPLFDGKDMGLMSDAGCPGIADPGADVIKLAHQKNIQVIPLAGPSSIVLSIMASGFNGQNFAFNGYLPIDKPLRLKRIKELETLAVKYSQAQFFIETPYRNDQLFESLLSALSLETLVFIGKDLTATNQFISTKSVFDWKKAIKPEINKVPVVFGIYKA